MRITILSILVNLCLLLQAQIYNYPIPISATTTHVTEKNGKGIFVAQKLRARFQVLDFIKEKMKVFISEISKIKYLMAQECLQPPEENISNCPNATVYVGRFKNGIKNGNGICYNSAGEAIYIGKFLDDVPIDNYGDSVVSPIKYLSDAKTEKFYYIGEFSSDLPNGFGAIFFQNGDLLISKFKDGVCDGICIYLETDGNWTTENVSRDEISFISSSREYASYVQQSKSEWNAAWKKALGSWEDWSAAFANLSNQLQQISDSSEVVRYHILPIMLQRAGIAGIPNRLEEIPNIICRNNVHIIQINQHIVNTTVCLQLLSQEIEMPPPLKSLNGKTK